MGGCLGRWGMEVLEGNGVSHENKVGVGSIFLTSLLENVSGFSFFLLVRKMFEEKALGNV